MRRRVNVPAGVVCWLCCVSLSSAVQGSDATALSLEEAVKIALQNNSVLKASELGVDAT